jgi:hypothetical protein
MSSTTTTTTQNTTKTSSRHTYLADKWNLYYHLPNDKSWDASSYKLIMGNIETVEQVIGINETLPRDIIQSCMLYVTRHGILPLWEDVQNCNGGAYSYKIVNKDVELVWRQLFYLLCGNSLMVNVNHMSHVNGISVSPKKGFCIVKIWLRDCSLQDPDYVTNIPKLMKEGCLFKKHDVE